MSIESFRVCVLRLASCVRLTASPERCRRRRCVPPLSIFFVATFFLFLAAVGRSGGDAGRWAARVSYVGAVDGWRMCGAQRCGSAAAAAEREQK